MKFLVSILMNDWQPLRFPRRPRTFELAAVIGRWFGRISNRIWGGPRRLSVRLLHSSAASLVAAPHLYGIADN
jgi:hypothetical protein